MGVHCASLVSRVWFVFVWVRKSAEGKLIHKAKKIRTNTHLQHLDAVG